MTKIYKFIFSVLLWHCRSLAVCLLVFLILCYLMHRKCTISVKTKLMVLLWARQRRDVAIRWRSFVFSDDDAGSVIVGREECVVNFIHRLLQPEMDYNTQRIRYIKWEEIRKVDMSIKLFYLISTSQLYLILECINLILITQVARRVINVF